MGVINECVASGHEFEHKGKVYKVRLVDQEVKDAYGKALYKKAREAAAGMRELMTPAEYGEHLKRLNDDYIAGKYALESDFGLKMMHNTTGGLLLVSILLGVTEMDAMKVLAERKTDVAGLLDVVLRESFPDVPQGEGQPDGESKSGQPG